MGGAIERAHSIALSLRDSSKKIYRAKQDQKKFLIMEVAIKLLREIYLLVDMQTFLMCCLKCCLYKIVVPSDSMGL